VVVLKVTEKRADYNPKRDVYRFKCKLVDDAGLLEGEIRAKDINKPLFDKLINAKIAELKASI